MTTQSYLQEDFLECFLYHTDNLLLLSQCPKGANFPHNALIVGLIFFVMFAGSSHNLVKLGGPKHPGISSQSIAVTLVAESLVATTYECLEIVAEAGS